MDEKSESDFEEEIETSKSDDDSVDDVSGLVPPPSDSMEGGLSLASVSFPDSNAPDQEVAETNEDEDPFPPIPEATEYVEIENFELTPPDDIRREPPPLPTIGTPWVAPGLGGTNPSLMSAMADSNTVIPGPRKLVRPEPVGETERFASMDVMRGVAIFGILIVNIQDFALITSARYAWWMGAGGRSEINQTIWEYTFFFFDTKFIAIFTMLFGAGIAVFEEKRVRSGKRYLVSYFNRMLILLLVGAVHTIVIWDGDILYDYAFWGIILFFAPRLPVGVLFLWSMAMLWANGANLSAGWATVPRTTDYELVELYRGEWWAQVEHRWEQRDFSFLGMPLAFVFQAVGHMTMGMALYKSRILTGKWPAWNYLVLVPLFGYFGYTMIDGSGLIERRPDIEMSFDLFYWGSLLLTFAYMSATIFAGKTMMWFWPVRALASAGRMALTNYLFQSAVCTTIFYGWGFGQYERWDRTQLLALIVTIIVFELLFSWLWFRKFQFGPVEWLWRTATYGKLQPMIKEEVRRPKLWGDVMPDEKPSIPS